MSVPDRRGPRVSSAVDLRPDESLISAIARTTAKNHLPRISRLLNAADGVYHSFVNLAAREDVDFDQLAWTARLAPHEVQNRRYRPINIHPTLPGFIFHGAMVPVYDLRLKNRRVTPSWLRGDPYQSAIGHHVLIPHCPATGEIMFDSCPGCGARLTWTQFDMTRCDTCALDLARLDGERIPEKKRRAASLMADIIHPHPARHLAAARRLPADLAVLDRGGTFELGWRLGSIISGQGFRHRDNARHLSVETRLEILICGSRLLLDWPGSLAAVINDRVASPNGLLSNNPIRELRQMVAYGSAWPDHRRLLCKVVPGLDKSDAMAVKLALVAGGDAAETTKALGVGQTVFERLRASKHLTPVLDRGRTNRHQIFDVSHHAEMIARIADRRSINSVSERLGIERHGAEQLCCIGHLTVFDEGYMRDAYRERQVASSSFARLVTLLENKSFPIDEAERISLTRAIQMIGAREKPWGAIIDNMISGHLQYHLNKATGSPLMRRVDVRATDLRKIASMHFDREAYPRFDFERQMPRRDAERLLNTSPRYMSLAIKERDIVRDANQMFDREHVIGLAEKFISGGEILIRWGSGNKKPAPFCGRRKLQRVSSLGWVRSDVEELMEKLPPKA